MICKNIFFIFFIGIIITSCNQKKKETQIVATKLKPELIFPKGDIINNSNFTGHAYLTMLIQADSINRNSVGNVTFEAGARTNWHIHPNGQIILALEGEGFYQEQGSAKRILRKGDVVKCPANVPHWHGASPYSEFIQIAITSRVSGPTEWLNPVTEEEYNEQ